jgi:hypothetical protein
MSRRLDALRALAERPGTEAEGIVAREMLAKLEAKTEEEWPSYLNSVLESERPRWSAFADFLKTGKIEDLDRATRFTTCPCGRDNPRDMPCLNEVEHVRINAEIRQMFPVGTRVYYNRWAYAPNEPGVVVGYSKNWSWLRIKFDKLKTSRAVPVYDCRYCLFTESVPYEDLRSMNIRGGMESIEDLALAFKP